jgi:hypothetical protein
MKLSQGHYQRLMQALEWLQMKAGFSQMANCSWTLRQELINQPLILEIRQMGHLLFTLEYSQTTPRVLIPSRFAMTFDGEQFKLYRMLSSVELIECSKIHEHPGLLHLSQVHEWLNAKKDVA